MNHPHQNLSSNGKTGIDVKNVNIFIKSAIKMKCFNCNRITNHQRTHKTIVIIDVNALQQQKMNQITFTKRTIYSQKYERMKKNCSER